MRYLSLFFILLLSLHAVQDYNQSWSHQQKAKYYNLEAIKDYLLIYEDVNEPDGNEHNGYDMLAFAISSGELESVKYLVEHGCNVNHQDKDGHAPLIDAVLLEQYEIVKYLIDKGADVNIKSKKEKETALHFAQATQNLKIISHLIKKGADLEAKDSKGQTPLFLAGTQGNLPVVKFLVMKGAKIDFEPDTLSDDWFWVSDDKVAKVIAYLKAIKIDRNIKPPTLDFNDTPLVAKQERSTITLRIKDQGSGIGKVHLFVNGSEIYANPTRGLKKKRKKPKKGEKVDNYVTKHYAIQLQQGLNYVKAYVYDAKNQMQSDDYFLQIVGDYKLDKRPTLHAVVIGIDQFNDQSLNLSYAKADATLFGTTLYKRSKEIFANVNIRYLREKDITSKAAIKKALGDLSKISANDFFVFYAASHGIIVDKTFYMLTSDQSGQTPQQIKAQGISQEEFRVLFKHIPTANKLLVFDTCYSGLINEEISQKLARGTTRKLNLTSISAAQSKETALEGYADGHGVFTYVLSDALEGEADLNGDGMVQSLELVQYVKATVPHVAKKYNHTQTPAYFQSGQVFTVTKLRSYKGKVNLKPQYFESKEIKKLAHSLEKKDKETFNKVVKKNKEKTKKVVKKVIKKKVASKQERKVEKKTPKKQQPKKVKKEQPKKSQKGKKIEIKNSDIALTLTDDSLILPVKDKLMKHFSFINAKNEPIIVLDFHTSKFTKHSITPVLSSKVAAIKIGWHYDFYRIAIQMKKPSSYKLIQNKNEVRVTFKDK
jgi:uncharacterized caspase-like protein